MVNKSISHYTILDKLGEGGMGVVYKAQDTKLNRLVALKFLPDRVNKDEAAKARFLQEAQAAAALNHPNICTIYGVDEHEGHLFISMEFIEGGTLRDSIPYAKTADALLIATQISEALNEAHSKGIVHRDVKADNVMLTAKGQPKVMDFGLARLKGALKLTRSSSTVGTLAYMAPEQIQSGEVDHRSDIFSFGVLLFEMLTGKLPFRGEHEAAMVYSIVNEEPQDIATQLPDVSPIVANLIQRCLEKDPAERYQHFDDITADLRRAQKKTTRVMRSSASIPAMQPEMPEPSTQMRTTTISSLAVSGGKSYKLIGAVVAGLAVIALAFFLLSGPSLPQLNPEMTVTTVQLPVTESQYPSISSDGKWLTFPGADLNGKWDIYMMDIETGESKRVTHDSTESMGGSGAASFSPDGSMIAYVRRSKATGVSEICVVSVLTGSVRVVADSAVRPIWNSTGDRLFYMSNVSWILKRSNTPHEYWSVSPQGTGARIEAVDSLISGPLTFFAFDVSPDGKKIAFTRATGNFNEVIVQDLASHQEVQLTNDKKVIDEVFWADNGYMFYSSDKSGNFNVWAIPESGGTPVQVTKGEGPDFGISISNAANRLVFSQSAAVNTLWMLNTDGTGYRQLFPDENIASSHISPDGQNLALLVTHPTKQPSIMVRGILSGRQQIVFPHDSVVNRGFPLWSPSGRKLSSAEFVQGKTNTNIVDFERGGQVQRLENGGILKWLSDSTVMLQKTITDSSGTGTQNIMVRKNIITGEEMNLGEGNAIPVLRNTKMFVARNGAVVLVNREEYQQNPNAPGTAIMKPNEVRSGDFNDNSAYFVGRDNSLWKFDFRTLKRTRLMDIPAGVTLNLGGVDYADKVVTFTQTTRKTRIVKIDNLFAQ